MIENKKAGILEKYPHFTQKQLDILSSLKTGQINNKSSERYKLSLLEMTNREFLYYIASLSLKYELALVEENGEGIITTGILDKEGSPAAGDDAINKLHKTGKISIHTHIGQEFHDLCPSPGDIEILGMLRIYADSKIPPVIMNSQGILVFGFEPDFFQMEQQSNEPGKYSWKLKNRCGWEFDRLKRCVVDHKLSLDEAIKQFLNFQKDNGIIKLHKLWNDVTDADISFLRNN